MWVVVARIARRLWRNQARLPAVQADMRAVVFLTSVLLGLLVGALMLRSGWELPVHTSCSGDVCTSQSWVDVDWDRVNWELKPTRIACFEANPANHDVLIGPGDECVRSRGDVIEHQASYEELREEIQQRRTRALAFAGAAIALPPILVEVWWRVRRRPAPTAH
ncbi:hypothetical protein [Plantactinospora soyae]|uniref:Uncharacterized protein n=1 Tax=Plantactinospora soyae TaxID=1544732 RepID=A0A927R6M0_9ACTN|nr:hypothetical protein [Plantactinospora soyae]MBE1488579.1 hypothetical protein [Plantactinospora soyae]